MGVGDLWDLYKAWKSAKGAVKRIDDDGGRKILELSFQVDRLEAEYSSGGDAVTKSILERLNNIRRQLLALASTMPSIPSLGKDATMKYLESTIAAENTRAMAQNELLRIQMDQYADDLPSDVGDPWPVKRASYIRIAEMFRKSAVFGRTLANTQQADIQNAINEEDGVREGQKVIADPSAQQDLADALQQWHDIEVSLTTRRDRIRAMAAVMDARATQWDNLIDAGDLEYKKQWGHLPK